MWKGTRRNRERVNWLKCVVQENSLFSTLKEDGNIKKYKNRAEAQPYITRKEFSQK